MEEQMPCSSSAPDNSAVHVIEIEDDCPLSPVPLEQEKLVEPLFENEDGVAEGKIHALPTLNSAQREADNEDDVVAGEFNAESTLHSAQRGNKRKTPYSVKFGELPEAVRKFLASVKRFFTQKVNFEREKAPVTLSTYEKAQERMLCKYLCFFF